MAPTSLRSTATLSPTPLVSFSRWTGAPTTSAREPNRSSSALATGLVSRRGIETKEQQFKQFIVGERRVSAITEALSQAVAVSMVVGVGRFARRD